MLERLLENENSELTQLR